MLPKWIRLNVLNNRTLEAETPIEILASEICLLQQYEEKETKVIEGDPEKGIPNSVDLGHPAFVAVSMKSGLQYRVSERIEEVRVAIQAALHLSS